MESRKVLTNIRLPCMCRKNLACYVGYVRVNVQEKKEEDDNDNELESIVFVIVEDAARSCVYVCVQMGARVMVLLA
jgi:hypothetical protein